MPIRHNHGMTKDIEDLHVYQRSIHPNERTSLSVLAQLVQQQTTVLDLGCGSGALGQLLLQANQCTCDGLTFNEAEAVHAQPHYRRVVVADLETCDLLAIFPTEHYDYIICADVLEHLRTPERVLMACQKLLKPAGQLLVSVPNASYAGLVAELLQGEFRYREEGLLDSTHLRFFTRRSLSRFLTHEGWVVQQMETVQRALPASEFSTPFDSLPPAVSRYLLAVPDALTYQFIVRAEPLARLPKQLPHEAGGDTEPRKALFSAQLYWAVAGEYAEKNKVVVTGEVGTLRQTLTFPIPAMGTALTALRIDPADRPGFLHLYRLTIRLPDGTELWGWSACQARMAELENARQQQCHWHLSLPAASATLVLLTGDDPWIELPIPLATFAKMEVTESVLEMEVGWPMSADYLALSDSVRTVYQDLHRLEASNREYQASVAQLSQSLALVSAQSELLASQKTALLSEKQNLQRHVNQLQIHSDRLDARLIAIENSTVYRAVYRASRPLARVKMWVDRNMRNRPTPMPSSALPHPVPVPPPGYPVDVIVPVYRGIDDTRRCIESVLTSPCQTPFRLVVINDASPEPALVQWLRSLQGQDERFVLLENPENLGFVGTVNRGMAFSDTHDVLLLNSDTEVANDWLDRLRHAAYSDQKIASVTPFSNNATICSYPRFCEDNQLPEGYDVARLDALFSRTHPGAVVDIPTAIGFCMYIRRDCLEQVGLFDVENFGKGYGEENDFCCRATASGWRNLHALDTFVLHSGGVSFGASKTPRELAAMETMRRLHPRYEQTVHDFVMADPAGLYRMQADLARVAESQRTVVLAVLHDRAGGTIRHVQELSRHLHQQAVFFSLTPEPDNNVLLRLMGPGEAFQLHFSITQGLDELVHALRSLGVAHIHYHHLLGHSRDILLLPTLLNIRYDFTAHDYYTVCPQITLTDETHQYCGESGVEQCRRCLQRSPAPGGLSIEAWRTEHSAFVTQARHVLVPSMDAGRRFSRYIPGADIRFAPHTDIPSRAELLHPLPPRLMPDAPLKIAVIGALGAIKGADLLEDVAIAAAKVSAPVEFHLLGYGYRPLSTQPRACLTVHGQYIEQDLPALLKWLAPDLVWFPAQCPETYSYTLSTCLQLGLPVVAPDLGAFPERLSTRPWSWIRPWNDTAEQWLDFFRSIRQDHFMSGKPPLAPLPLAPIPEDALVQAWSYQRDYQIGIQTRGASTALTADFLLSHLYKTGSRIDDTRHTLKRLALRGLVRLRSIHGMRSIAQNIPMRWQAKVKNWLRS